MNQLEVQKIIHKDMEDVMLLIRNQGKSQADMIDAAWLKKDFKPNPFALPQQQKVQMIAKQVNSLDIRNESSLDYDGASYSQNDLSQ